MSTVCQYLGQHGVALLAAATCLLAVGCMATALQRTPIHRQRAGELTVLAVLIWAVLACIPMSRYSPSAAWSVVSAAWGPMWPLPRQPLPENLPVVLPHLPPTVSETAKAFEEPTAAPDLPMADSMPIAAEDVAQWTLRSEPELPTVAESASCSPQIEAPAAHSAETAGVTRSTLTASVSSPAADVRHAVWLLYAAGGLACLAWLVLGRVLLWRILLSATSPEPWMQELYQAIPFSRRRPRLLVSPRCTRALSFGTWRPTIVLPAADCRVDRAGSIRHVLRHELAHAGQGDARGHLLFNLAFPLLYFHPLYWWLRSQAYLAAELIADDWAADSSAKTTYVEALVGLVKQRNGRSLAYFGSAEIFGSRSQFYRRMQMLLNREVPLASRCSKPWRLVYPTVCLMAVLLAAAAVGVMPADGQEEAASGGAAATVSEMIVETVESPADMEDFADVAVEAPAGEPAQINEDRVKLESSLKAMQKELLALRRSLAEQLAAKDELRKQLDGLQAARVQAAKDKAAAESSLQQLLQKAKEAQRGTTAHEAFVQWLRGKRPEQAEDTAAVMALLQDLVAGKAAKEKEAAIAAQKKALEALKTAQDTAAKARLVRKGYISEKTAQQPVARPGQAMNLMDAISAQLPVQAAQPHQDMVVVDQTIIDTKPQLTATRTFAASEMRDVVRGQLDLVALATAYSDAVANLEVTKLQYERLAELQKKRVVSTQEAAIAAIQAKAAERKLMLLRRIAESALNAADAEIRAVQAQYSREKKAGGNALQTLEAQLIHAKSRIEILRSILAAD